MTVAKSSDLLRAADIHANRPAATAVPAGALYSCTTHSLVYRSDGATWSTWATLGGGGGGGGGLAASYLGKTTVGASWGVPSTQGTFKKITTTPATVLLGIALHLSMNVDAVANMGVALFSDNAGTLGRLLGYNSWPVADTILLDGASGEVAGSGVGRWFEMPLTYQLAAATSYWVGMFATDFTTLQIAYDTGGTDKTFQTGNNWIADAPRYTVAATTRDHSIRANVLA